MNLLTTLILLYLPLRLFFLDALIDVCLLLLRNFCSQVFDLLIKNGSINLEPRGCRSVLTHPVFSFSLLPYYLLF